MSLQPYNMSNPSFVLRKPLDLVFEDRPDPKIQDPHSVKVAVKKTGVCGSDVHYYLHGGIGEFIVKAPMVLGHESAGEVVEVGPEVKDLKVGDRVALEPGVPSRLSQEYKEGRYNLCPCMVFAATPPYDGTLCRHYIIPEDFCVKLPDHVSLEEGALVEPLSVAVHCNKLAKTTAQDVVIVFGAGPVGLLAVGVANAFGSSTIVCVDLVPEKLELAKKFGATHTFVPTKGDSPNESADKIRALIKGYGLSDSPNVALECTGAEPSIQTAVSVLATSGRLVQVGMGKDDVNFPITKCIVKEITVLGSFRYCHGDYPLAVQLVASGKIDVKQLVTNRFTFKEAEKAYKTAAEGKAIKIIIDGPEEEK